MEESVRLILLLVIGMNAENAYSLGIGWAMIEVIYGLIQIIGLGVLDKKTDAKALEAKTKEFTVKIFDKNAYFY